MTVYRGLIGALIVLGFIVQPASADQSFYKGKVLRIAVSATAGTSYDLYSRLVAPYISKYIPGNPKYVVMNMPGAGGTTAADWLYAIAKKDGLTLGAIQPTLPLLVALGAKQARFEPTKFNWIGTPMQETASCFVRSDTAYRTANDLVEMTEAPKMAATPSPSDSSIVPLALNSALGAHMKVVTSGYTDIETTISAVDKGHVDGICGLSYAYLKAQNPDWLQNNTIRFLVQVGRKKDPALKDVPLASELTKGNDDLLSVYTLRFSVGRPWLLPPGVPPERVAATRHAFAKAMKDPDFLKAAEKARLQIDPLPGKDLQTLMHEMVSIVAEKPALKKYFKH